MTIFFELGGSFSPPRTLKLIYFVKARICKSTDKTPCKTQEMMTPPLLVLKKLASPSSQSKTALSPPPPPPPSFYPPTPLCINNNRPLGHLVHVVQCGRSILKINWYEWFPNKNRELYIHICALALSSKPQIW